MWKRPWFIVAVAAIVVGGGTLIYVNSREDDASNSVSEPDLTIPEISIPDISLPDVSIPETTIPSDLPITIPAIPSLPGSSVPATTIPAIPTPPTPTTVPGGTATTTPSGVQPVVGETVTWADGTTVRLNSVTPNAPPVQDFFDVEAGNVLTRVDYDACAGSNGFSSLNPLYWTGSLDDGTEASVFLFSFDILTLQLAPGACVRSQFDFEAPSARVVTTIAVRDATFQEAGRWATASSVPVAGSLASANPVAAAPVGQPVTLAGGAVATVRTVTPNSEPLDSLSAEPGRQFTRIDVEVCAGTAAISSNPQNWFGQTTDSQIGGSAFFGATFPSGDIAPGQCVSGLVDIDIPAETTIRDIVLSDDSSMEIARWRQG